jgi:hypothetical protein
MTQVKNVPKKFECCHEDPPNVVQLCISIETPIVDNPFQHYETKPPNQLRDKIDQFKSFGVTPLQAMNSLFFHLVLMKHCHAFQNISMCETPVIIHLL